MAKEEGFRDTFEGPNLPQISDLASLHSLENHFLFEGAQRLSMMAFVLPLPQCCPAMGSFYSTLFTLSNTKSRDKLLSFLPSTAIFLLNRSPISYVTAYLAQTQRKRTRDRLIKK